jgi:hypothetical protein
VMSCKLEHICTTLHACDGSAQGLIRDFMEALTHVHLCTYTSSAGTVRSPRSCVQACPLARLPLAAREKLSDWARMEFEARVATADDGHGECHHWSGP